MKKQFKIKEIVLLFTACLPMLFFLFFSINKISIRHRMKEKLEKEMLVSLTIDSKELQWVKKGKEILVDGRMFDIKTIHFDGKAYKITGLFDDDETFLDRKLEEQQKKEGSSGKLIVHLMYLVQGVFFNTQLDECVAVQNQNQFAALNDKISSSPFQSVPTPPPQIV